MERSISNQIIADLRKKIVLLSGPRQVGKTYLSKSILKNFEYLNFDDSQDRDVISAKSWRRDCDLVVFDEVHKMKNWKSWIKGVYDKEGVKPNLLLTGSARLDVFKRGGDSLAGRFFYYRLHPFSVSELKEEMSAEEALDAIMTFGGFPEPLMGSSEVSAKRWRKSHTDRIIREDLVDISNVRDLKSISILVELLARNVGSLVSYDSLARDLQVSPHTVKSWIELLEALYVVFIVTPYSKNIARAVLKQPKIYFYDTGFIAKEPSLRLENAVACALLKWSHYREDVFGEKRTLQFVRDKEKREVDFLTTCDGSPEYLVEVKLSKPDVANLLHFSKQFKSITPIEIVKNLDRELNLNGVPIKKASKWLAALDA